MRPAADQRHNRQLESMSTSSWDRLSSDGVPCGDINVNNPSPIAICGMAMRLPGGISSEDKLWEFVINKGNARIELPLERYNSEAFHGRTTHGYFLNDDIQEFDASMFKMTKAELDVLDPQTRLLLELTRFVVIQVFIPRASHQVFANLSEENVSKTLVKSGGEVEISECTSAHGVVRL